MNWLSVLCFSLIVSGCSGKRDVLCDSSVTKERIVSDIRQDFEANFNDTYLSFLNDIQVKEIVTISADDIANTRSCEAIVAIYTRPNNNVVKQTILFTNQTVSAGEVDTRSIYTWANTFDLLRIVFRRAVEPEYQQIIADNAGFKTYNDMQLFSETEKKLGQYEAELNSIDVQISLVSKQLDELGDDVATDVASIKPSFENGKSVLLTNSIIRMTPVELDVKVIKRESTRRPDLIKVTVENISDFTLSSIKLEAKVYAVEDKKNSDALLDASILTPLSPGEVSEVTVKLKYPARKSFSSFKPRTYSNIDWINVKDVKVVFTPKSFLKTNSNYSKSEFSQQYSTYSVTTGRKVHNDILYNAYYDLSSSLRSLKKSKGRIEAEVKDAKNVLALIDKTM